MLALASIAAFSLSTHLPQASGQSWDPRFHLNGAPGAAVLETYDDGSGPALYAGGFLATANDVPTNRIARWDGQSWTPLGAGLSVPNSNSAVVRAMTVFDDGSGSELYVGGFFSRAGSVPLGGIAKWNGQRWAAVGSVTAASVHVLALAVFDDGSGPALYAGGTFASIGGTAASGIAKWDGASWTPLGLGVSSFFNDPGNVEALAGYGGMLYAGGEFLRADGIPVKNIARWDGTKWHALGGGAVRRFASVTHVSALEVCRDRRGEFLAVGGDFDRLGGKPAAGIGRWNGETFEPIGPGLPGGKVDSLAQFDDGGGTTLYAGGLFVLPGAGRVTTARWNGRAWILVGDGLTVANGTSPVSSLEVFDDGSGKTLFAAGPFGLSGERVVVGVAELRQGEWFPPSASGRGVDIGLNAGDVTPISAFEVWDDGSGESLFAAGVFERAGKTAASRIAKWDGDEWTPLGEGLTGFSSDNVEALEVFDDGNGPSLYAGGTFSGAGSVAAAAIARWDGVAWWPLGEELGAPGLGFRPAVYVMQQFDDGSGPALFVGGAFSMAGSETVHSLAKWDGTTWSDVGGGVTSFTVGTVSSMVVFDDGSGPALYIGGSFDAAGGSPALGIARWDGTTLSEVGGGLGSSFRTVRALAVFDDGLGEALYAGGQFNTAGGMTANNLARWDGSSWTAMGLDREVAALAVHDDGTGPVLYAGGEFGRTIAGQPLSRIGRWDGTSWTALGTGLDGNRLPRVEALQSFSHDGVPALYAGGKFDTASGRRSANIGRWAGSGRRRLR